MYKVNYGNNTRRKINSHPYKYRCEAREALGRRPLRYPFRSHWKLTVVSEVLIASIIMALPVAVRT
jgi:hypothetical protein